MRNIVIIGGGLAGLICSIQLARAGISCTVLEKKSYPLHRVCGEYVSNEAMPFLKSSGLYPEDFDLPEVRFLEFSTISGKRSKLLLDLGGFGISRFTFDHFLYSVAQREGVHFLLNTEALAIRFENDAFEVEHASGTLNADLVIGAHGKRSKLDVQQKRAFIQKRSPWVGVKYHVQADRPRDIISLHNFPGGYCGICSVENGITNVCYLTHRDNIRKWGEVAEMERRVMFRNPLIKNVFENAHFVFQKPEVINEVSFETKGPLENHILMAGDAAGMITPLCGNGMAIAIHSGKILSECATRYCNGQINRRELEATYQREWSNAFRTRLWFGRNVQRLLNNETISSLALSLASSSDRFSKMIMRRTHGNPF